jgi:hypothetical protein
VTAFPRSALGGVYLRTSFPLWTASIAKAPFFEIVSRDRRWVISEVTQGAASLFSNNEYSCQHAIAPFQLQPGESVSIQQRIYFLQVPPAAVLERVKRDFAE